MKKKKMDITNNLEQNIRETNDEVVFVAVQELKNKKASDQYDVSDMAKQTDTISHEIFVKLGSRYKRKYLL